MKKQVQDKKVFDIPEQNFVSFKSRIERLQRRAVKLGCGEIRWKVIEEFYKAVPLRQPASTLEENDPAEAVRKVKYYKVEIEGDQPKLAGWLFAARLEHDERIGTIIRVVPGVHIPPEFFDADLYNCDHCRKRIFRRDTFVVKHETTHEWKQVGRTCLKDFLGHEKPENIARYCELLFDACMVGEDSESFNGGGRAKYYYELEPFLATTSAMIRRHGWISRTKAKEDDYAIATADRVQAKLFNPADRDYVDVVVADSDIEEAKKVIAWAKDLQVIYSWEDEYLWNIHLIAEAEVLDDWKSGFAASMVMSYRKTMARERAIKESQWVGEIGKKITIKDAKLVFTTSYESQYGVGHLYKFTAGQNITLSWFSSSEPNIKQGDVCDIIGTVKKHDEYRGRKETILTRCKLENIRKEN